MFINREPPKMLYKSKREEDVLQKLSDYVDSHLSQPVEFLARLWEEQQEAISYQEIREAILNGDLDEGILERWRQNYAVIASARFAPVWLTAAAAGGAGQPLTNDLDGFSFDPRSKGIRRWVADRSGELITVVTEEQRAAVKAMIGRAVDGRYTVDELSRVIRPCVGLNRPQAQANMRYYETVRDNLLEKHPKMKVESAQRQAREMAVKYAEKQHRQRCYMIAETELVAAYNQGSEQAVKQAQQQGKLGAVRRMGSTADDERVCPKCAGKHGKEILEEEGTPPWHPRCRCAIAYEPTGEPYIDAGGVDEPDYVPIDDAVSYEANEQIQEDYDLLPPAHRDILDRELVEIRKSPVGNSYTNKEYGIIYVDDKIEKGEFIHEAAHLLEDRLGVFQDKRYLEILTDSLGDIEQNIIYDADTFTKAVYRVKSSKLITEYQGRYYEAVSIRREDGSINPYAFSDFFSEGYKAYILHPNKLKEMNPKLYDYIEEVCAWPA